MFIPDDWETFQKATGTATVPAGFLEEYEKRLRLQHRAGKTGALGIDGMVVLLRQFDLEPPKGQVARTEAIDWRRIPTGAKVLAKVNGEDKCGHYQGRVDSGTLAVLLEGRPQVDEFPAMHVRLAPAKIPDVESDELVEVKSKARGRKNAS